MENSFDKTASSTIDLLEARLRRLEFLLAGDTRSVLPQSRSDEVAVSVTERLELLEDGLNRLSSKSKVAKEILDLSESPPSLGVRTIELIGPGLRHPLSRPLPVITPRTDPHLPWQLEFIIDCAIFSYIVPYDRL
jgi:hypothetical protein